MTTTCIKSNWYEKLLVIGVFLVFALMIYTYKYGTDYARVNRQNQIDIKAKLCNLERKSNIKDSDCK